MHRNFGLPASYVGKEWEPWTENLFLPLPTHQWIHVAATFRQGLKGRVYVNGVASNHSTICNNNDGTDYLMIGSFGKAQYYADSWIKEVMVFNESLDDASIQKYSDNFRYAVSIPGMKKVENVLSPICNDGFYTERSQYTNSSLDNYFEQSHYWIPSNKWLHDCAQDYSSRGGGEWDIEERQAAIGDCIKFCACYHSRYANTTFNYMYAWGDGCPMKKGEDYWDKLHIVDEIHKVQSKYPSFTTPDPDALVIHLRLGDIVEDAKRSVEEILVDGSDPGYKPAKFRKGIKSVRELLMNAYEANVTKVNIIGGSHKKEQWKKSRVYAGCVRHAIHTAGFNVTMHIEGTHPDNDFYFMSHAHQLVVSAGGYSGFVGILAERRGGSIIGRSFGASWFRRRLASLSLLYDDFW